MQTWRNKCLLVFNINLVALNHLFDQWKVFAVLDCLVVQSAFIPHHHDGWWSSTHKSMQDLTYGMLV